MVEFRTAAGADEFGCEGQSLSDLGWSFSLFQSFHGFFMGFPSDSLACFLMFSWVPHQKMAKSPPQTFPQIRNLSANLWVSESKTTTLVKDMPHVYCVPILVDKSDGQDVLERKHHNIPVQQPLEGVWQKRLNFCEGKCLQTEVSMAKYRCRHVSDCFVRDL